jgi:hypothetical protein
MASTAAALVPSGQQAIAAYDYGADAGAGFEGQTSDDYSLPFITILQGLSPLVATNNDEGKYRIGQIVNTVTQRLYELNKKPGVKFIPVHTEHCFNEWLPDQGGFVAKHEITSKVVADAKGAATEFGKLKVGLNDLIECFYVYGIAMDENGFTEQAVVAFASTKIKKYKSWMTKARTVQIRVGEGVNARNINPPLYAHVFSLTAIDDKNKKGQPFKNWAIDWAEGDADKSRIPPTSDLYKQAKELAASVKAGKAKVDEASQVKTAGKAAGGEGDEEIPF